MFPYRSEVLDIFGDNSFLKYISKFFVNAFHFFFHNSLVLIESGLSRIVWVRFDPITKVCYTYLSVNASGSMLVIRRRLFSSPAVFLTPAMILSALLCNVSNSFNFFLFAYGILPRPM